MTPKPRSAEEMNPENSAKKIIDYFLENSKFLRDYEEDFIVKFNHVVLTALQSVREEALEEAVKTIEDFTILAGHQEFRKKLIKAIRQRKRV